MRSKVEEAVKVIMEYLDQVESVEESPSHYAIPRVCVDLQVPSGGGQVVHLEPTKQQTNDANFATFLSKVCSKV